MFTLPDHIDIPQVFFETPGLPMPQVTTLLYGIKPRGFGTGACESLMSYCSRLANEHRVGTRTLFKDVLKASLVEQNKCWISIDFTIKNKKFFISMGTLTGGLVSVLSEATGVSSLVNCTMLPMNGVLNSQGLLIKQERHCPLCLQGANDIASIYGHLIWKISCLTACPIHGTQLVPSECGNPEQIPLGIEHRKILSGVCSRCGSIGYKCREENTVLTSEIEVWKAQQVAELIALFPSATQLFSKQNTIMGLKALAETFYEGKPAIAARQAGMHKSVLWGWMRRHYLPSLGPLLDICLSVGVSLVSVMKGNPVKCISPQFKKSSKSRFVKMDGKRASMKEREKALKEALTIDPPQCLSAISSGLNLHLRTLSKQFPELAALVVERFRLFRSSQTAKNCEQTRVIAQDLIKEITTKGLPTTRRNFQEAAGKHLMPNDRLCKALLEMLPDHRFSNYPISED